MRHDFGDADLIHAARQLGDGLLRAAEYSTGGCSWRSHTFRYKYNLLGFSHGTAGVAYALLELHHATGAVCYLEAAEDAFRYERQFFNSEIGNWPDFREHTQRHRRQDLMSYKTFWCHGAPGIALSRLRAYQITGSEAYRREAETALCTTHNAVAASIQSRRIDYSLCHGLPGNADVLISGHQALGSAKRDDLSLARQAASVISRSNELGDLDRPGLMLGLAGVGYFFVRLYDTETPSVLMPPVFGDGPA